MSEQKLKFYRLKNIMKNLAHYYIIFGERSNGKTYAVIEHIIEKVWQKRTEGVIKQGAIIRRWGEDLKTRRAEEMFSGLVKNNRIKEITGGVWDTVAYKSRKWYFAKNTEEGVIVDVTPIFHGFTLNEGEHDKSISFPFIDYILFDEFITRGRYLNDEFVLFQNVLSTIIRERDTVIIFMLGNTVSQYCPYFSEMGLKHITEMEKGDIDVYKHNGGTIIAVEYADGLSKRGKPSDVYFTFDNPQLNMITKGDWEFGVYPHCPVKYNSSNIVFTFFIQFDTYTYEGNVIMFDKYNFLFIHNKTTEIKYEDALIFTLDANPSIYIKSNFGNDKISQKLRYYFNENKVFYQDNEVGEAITQFLQN